jgi:hypothetical protein
MKIRNGFVSNSSSSSFIVKSSISPAEFVSLFIGPLSKLREADYGDEWGEESKEFFGIQKRNAEVMIKENNSSPVVFSGTINYETFVWKEGDCLFVSTCNNDPWEDILDELDLDYSYYLDGSYKEVELEREKQFVDLEDFELLTPRQKLDKWTKQFEEAHGPLLGAKDILN